MGLVGILDVARYVLQPRKPMVAMKHQKLCWYSQAWFLADHGTPLFVEDFTAWDNGPVCNDLLAAHRGKYIVTSQDLPGGDADRLADYARARVDETLDAYGHLSAAQLGELARREDPWIRAMSRRKSGRDGIIPKDRMLSFYRTLKTSTNAIDVDEVDWPAWLVPSNPRPATREARQGPYPGA